MVILTQPFSFLTVPIWTANTVLNLTDFELNTNSKHCYLGDPVAAAAIELSLI